MKKLISCMLLLGMLSGMLSIGIAAHDFVVDDTFTLGDVNGDGVADPTDALEVARYLADVEGANVIQDAADMDADGQVSAYDALQFKMCIAGAKNFSDYEKTGNGEALYNFTIAGNPIDSYSLVVPENLPDDTDENKNVYGMNAYFAAKEMRKYIQTATGVDVPIVKGTWTTPGAIAFHIEDETGELGIEGYIYTVEDGQLHIYGTRRGCMYAVYDILEEYLGYRFYNSDETMLYKKRTADIPEGVYEKKIPLMSFREVGQTFKNRDEYSFPRKINGSNSTYSYYNGTSTGPHFINAHSFQYQWQMYSGPVAPEGTERPLSYRYENGDKSRGDLVWNPCFTDDTIYEQLFEGLVLIAKMITEEWGSHIFRPETSSLSFSPNDTDGSTGIMCKCANCATIYAESGLMGAIVNMANRAAVDIQEYYPGMKIMCGMYEHAMPNNIYPDKNLIIYYWGTGCNNHLVGSGDCGDNVNLLGKSNTLDEKCLKAWGDACAETGAELWFWYYPVTYSYYLVGCPNIINIYNDLKFLVEECHVTGFYHEGGGEDYNFEALKAYLSARMMEDPDMTEEEFIGILKEYLYMYYGGGYEELYQYILMQNEAGDRAGCFMNNYDRPRQMYDFAYIDEHYEEMRTLLTEARQKAKTAEQETRIDTLLACCDFLGLSCVHHRYYKNGTEESRALYMERYDNMYNYIKNNNMVVFPSESVYKLPDTISYTEDPMYQIYGNERPGVSRYPEK
ncbi:MAG: DUF4838 domain-containing protein [Clostridiales bacterium]|jgi:hypothetical protein|nr:DUF4838 domain-containing protein [Clostridiales bacterium]